MDSTRRRALGVAVTVQVSRFLVLLAAVLLAPAAGISGWFVGLAANVACTVFAVVLVTRFRLWRRIGWTWRTRGRRSLLWLTPFVVEALLWTVPVGFVERPPGYGWWSLSLLLVGVNEELTSRGVILSRLERAFPPGASVAITAALFGLQHLSAFATTSRGGVDILGNVLASACFGAALGAYQSRFRWIVPLILAHAVLDFTAVLGARSFGDLAVVAMSLAYVAVGVLILRGRSPADRAVTGTEGRYAGERPASPDDRTTQ